MCESTTIYIVQHPDKCDTPLRHLTNTVWFYGSADLKVTDTERKSLCALIFKYVCVSVYLCTTLYYY